MQVFDRSGYLKKLVRESVATPLLPAIRETTAYQAEDRSRFFFLDIAYDIPVLRKIRYEKKRVFEYGRSDEGKHVRVIESCPLPGLGHCGL